MDNEQDITRHETDDSPLTELTDTELESISGGDDPPADKMGRDLL